jgi:hypothetical protein
MAGCRDLDRAAGVNDELGMLIIDRQDRAGIAEVILLPNVRGGGRLDQQTVTMYALSRGLTGLL